MAQYCVSFNEKELKKIFGKNPEHCEIDKALYYYHRTDEHSYRFLLHFCWCHNEGGFSLTHNENNFYSFNKDDMDEIKAEKNFLLISTLSGEKWKIYFKPNFSLESELFSGIIPPSLKYDLSALNFLFNTSHSSKSNYFFEKRDKYNHIFSFTLNILEKKAILCLTQSALKLPLYKITINNISEISVISHELVIKQPNKSEIIKIDFSSHWDLKI